VILCGAAHLLVTSESDYRKYLFCIEFLNLRWFVHPRGIASWHASCSSYVGGGHAADNPQRCNGRCLAKLGTGEIT
jgi:hypothetical protein